jgi:hypothetical protein
VDLDADPLLLRKSGSAGNRTRTSGSVARNSDDKTIEAVSNNNTMIRKLMASELLGFWTLSIVLNSKYWKTKRWTKSCIPVSLSVLYHRQNALNSRDRACSHDVELSSGADAYLCLQGRRSVSYEHNSPLTFERNVERVIHVTVMCLSWFI